MLAKAGAPAKVRGETNPMISPVSTQMLGVGGKRPSSTGAFQSAPPVDFLGTPIGPIPPQTPSMELIPDRLSVAYHFPLKWCDHCGNRKTGWQVTRTSDTWEYTHRTCPHCMDKRARRLVESIYYLNDTKLERIGYPKRGAWE